MEWALYSVAVKVKDAMMKRLCPMRCRKRADDDAVVSVRGSREGAWGQMLG